MREIKFRCFCKKTKRWLTDKECSENLGDWFVYNPEVPAALGIEIVQYTGLKDKGGEEIYEGDILQTKNVVNAVRWVCVFEMGCFVFKAIKRDLDPIHSGENLQVEEVIGNIYENPELLEAPK